MKGATGEPWGHNLKLTQDILDLIMKSKKKVFGVFSGSFETYNLKYEKKLGT